jgi:hypothetical protein
VETERFPNTQQWTQVTSQQMYKTDASGYYHLHSKDQQQILQFYIHSYYSRLSFYEKNVCITNWPDLRGGLSNSSTQVHMY